MRRWYRKMSYFSLILLNIFQIHITELDLIAPTSQKRRHTPIGYTFLRLLTGSVVADTITEDATGKIKKLDSISLMHQARRAGTFNTWDNRL